MKRLFIILAVNFELASSLAAQITDSKANALTARDELTASSGNVGLRSRRGPASRTGWDSNTAFAIEEINNIRAGSSPGLQQRPRGMGLLSRLRRRQIPRPKIDAGRNSERSLTHRGGVAARGV